MKIDIHSFKKKLKDNFNDLSGAEESEEVTSQLLEALPMVFQISEQKDVDIIARLSQEVLKSEKENIEDCVLALMAAAVLERNNFTFADYEHIIEYAKELFGEEALHARFQAKLNAALLRDYSNEQKQNEALENFQTFLVQNSDNILVNQDFLYKIYTAIYHLTLQDQRIKYSIPSRFFEEVELLFMEYNIERKKESLFSSSIARKEKNEKQEDSLLQKASKLVSGKNILEKVKKLSPGEERTFFTFNKFNSAQKSKNAWAKLDSFYDDDLADLENYGLAYRDTILLDQVRAFRSLLIPQGFRMVVLGEGKRGKSSVVNALLGKKILPTKAVLPETATLVEIFYSEENTFEIDWLDKNEFEELEKILLTEESNILLQKKFENLKKIFENQELFENLQEQKITRLEDLHEFVSAEGLYTALIKKVKIGINSENIPQGISLIDTPALNASDPFYHILTREEALKADCLIVVLDARKPDSYSEISFLKELAKQGRVVKVIGVLSYPPDSASDRELAKIRAFQTLEESVRKVEDIEIIDVFMFNPKEVIESYEKSLFFSPLAKIQKQNFDEEYLLFVEGITSCVQEGIRSSLFSKRLETTFNHLINFADTHKKERSLEYVKNLPTKQYTVMLKNHAKHLALAVEKYADHARNLVFNVHHDIENWRINSEKNIILLEERIVLHITKAMHKHADLLENDFAKEAQWVEFDKENAPAIAKALLEEFMDEQRANLHAWEEKIQIFNTNMQELSLECFEEIQKFSEDLSAIASTKSNFDHLMVKSLTYMNRLTLFLGGAGTGLLASSGILNTLALGTATLAFLTSPIVIPSALLLGVTAYALHSFAKPSKRKEYFLEKKEVKVREFAKQISEELNKQLDQIQDELVLAYSQAVHKSLVPALEIMASEAVNIHLYVQVVEKQSNELSKNLKELSS